jgi:hypothetical protein
MEALIQKIDQLLAQEVGPMQVKKRRDLAEKIAKLAIESGYGPLPIYGMIEPKG